MLLAAACALVLVYRVARMPDRSSGAWIAVFVDQAMEFLVLLVALVVLPRFVTRKQAWESPELGGSVEADARRGVPDKSGATEKRQSGVHPK